MSEYYEFKVHSKINLNFTFTFHSLNHPLNSYIHNTYTMKLIIMWSIFVYCSQSTLTSFSTCPKNTPETGDQCNFKDTCYYGKESCCIEDKIETFNSYGCKCEDGRTLCFYTEACMGGRVPATCDNNNTPVCGGIENCAVYKTGHLICRCDDFGPFFGKELCASNELTDENISPRKCSECTDGYILNTATGICQNKSDIIMRRRLIMTNDNSVIMSIGIIMGALIVLSIIIGVLIVFYYKQKRATVDLLANA
eukprot:337836_1